MGLRKGWLQEVESYISTLEEDLDYLNKENGQLLDRIRKLRKALKEISSDEHLATESSRYVARKALADDGY